MTDEQKFMTETLKAAVKFCGDMLAEIPKVAMASSVMFRFQHLELLNLDRFTEDAFGSHLERWIERHDRI